MHRPGLMPTKSRQKTSVPKKRQDLMPVSARRVRTRVGGEISLAAAENGWPQFTLRISASTSRAQRAFPSSQALGPRWCGLPRAALTVLPSLRPAVGAAIHTRHCRGGRLGWPLCVPTGSPATPYKTSPPLLCHTLHHAGLCCVWLRAWGPASQLLLTMPSRGGDRYSHSVVSCAEEEDGRFERSISSEAGLGANSCQSLSRTDLPTDGGQ